MVLSLANRIKKNAAFYGCEIFPSAVNASPKDVLLTQRNLLMITKRLKTFYRSGALRPMPRILPFGFFGLIFSVLSGLFIGAAISKNVANFLEENDLFVPSDDDDDED